MPVHILDPLQDPRWPDFLERHPGASVFHSRGWLDALRRTHGYEPVAYTTSPPSAELANALVVCRVRSWLTGRRLVSLPFSDHCEPLVDRDEDLHDLLGALRRDSAKDNWKYVELRPLRRPVGGGTGFETSEIFYLHRIDLRPSLEALFKSLHKNCTQRKITRAAREALIYEEGRSEALLRKFYDLLVVTCRRRRLPPQPLDWFRRLIDTLGHRLTIHVASKDDRPIAGILTLAFKRSLVYKYGCSDTRSSRLGGMHFLLWNAIQEAKRAGMDEFDLGRSDVHTPGLVTFKNRWGATRSVLSYARYSASPVRGASTPRTLGIAKRFFARMPDNCLIAAGRMLYRHSG